MEEGEGDRGEESSGAHPRQMRRERGEAGERVCRVACNEEIEAGPDDDPASAQGVRPSHKNIRSSLSIIARILLPPTSNTA